MHDIAEKSRPKAANWQQPGRSLEEKICSNALAASIPGAGNMIGVSRASIYKLLKDGKLPWCKIGRRTVIPISAINDFMSKLTKQEA